MDRAEIKRIFFSAFFWLLCLYGFFPAAQARDPYQGDWIEGTEDIGKKKTLLPGKIKEAKEAEEQGPALYLQPEEKDLSEEETVMRHEAEERSGPEGKRRLELETDRDRYYSFEEDRERERAFQDMQEREEKKEPRAFPYRETDIFKPFEKEK